MTASGGSGITSSAWGFGSRSGFFFLGFCASRLVASAPQSNRIRNGRIADGNQSDFSTAVVWWNCLVELPERHPLRRESDLGVEGRRGGANTMPVGRPSASPFTMGASTSRRLFVRR